MKFLVIRVHSVACNKMLASNSAAAIRTRTRPEGARENRPARNRWRTQFATNLCPTSTQVLDAERRCRHVRLRSPRSHRGTINRRTIARIVKLVQTIRSTVSNGTLYVTAGIRNNSRATETIIAGCKNISRSLKLLRFRMSQLTLSEASECKRRPFREWFLTLCQHRSEQNQLTAQGHRESPTPT